MRGGGYDAGHGSSCELPASIPVRQGPARVPWRHDRGRVSPAAALRPCARASEPAGPGTAETALYPPWSQGP
jgi:hypothetical protein